jgi:hypothetical protein
MPMKRPIPLPILFRKVKDPFWVSEICSEYSSRENKNEILCNLDQKMLL